jgi:hypothetical protein
VQTPKRSFRAFLKIAAGNTDFRGLAGIGRLDHMYKPSGFDLAIAPHFERFPAGTAGGNPLECCDSATFHI